MGDSEPLYKCFKGPLLVILTAGTGDLGQYTGDFEHRYTGDYNHYTGDFCGKSAPERETSAHRDFQDGRATNLMDVAMCMRRTHNFPITHFQFFKM